MTIDIHNRFPSGGSASTLSTDPRDMQEAAWKILNHDQAGMVMAKIYSRFDAATADMYLRHLCTIQNPFRRIADLLSVTYTIPVARDSKDGPLNAAVRDHVPLLDVALDEVEKLKNGIGDAFCVPYFDEDEKQVMFHLYPPHEWDPVRKANYSIDYFEHIPAGVRYYTDGWIARKGGDGEWSDREFLSKVCPVVWFRLNPMSKKWSVGRIRDLIVATIEVGMDETLNKLSDFVSSYRQAFLKDFSGTPSQRTDALESMRLGIDTLLEREIGTVELGDPNNPFYDTIRKKISDIAATRGISDKAYFSTEQVQVFSPELRKIWRSATKYQLEPEMKLLRAVVALLAKAKIVPDAAIDAKWKIDYREPIPEEADPSKALEILAKAIELGQDSPIEAILRNDRECVTREDAEEKLKQRAKDRLELKKLMIELNISGDPAKNDDKTPAENGADGGKLSAQLRKESAGTYDGKSGPPVMPKDV